MSLLTLAEAIDQLRVESTEAIVDEVEQLMAEASDVVLDYVTTDDKVYWTAETAPGRVKVATRLVLTTLYDDRTADPLTPGVKNVLRRLRDPSLA